MPGVICRSTTGVFHRSQLGVFGCPRIWEFTDEGFVYGGQNGAYRAYSANKVGVVSTVAESPWMVLRQRPSLRLDWENDDNCPSKWLDGKSGNAYEQIVTARTVLNMPSAGRLKILITGMAETEDPQEPLNEVFERMELYGDDALWMTGHSPGGGLDCDGGMAPVVTDVEAVITIGGDGIPYIDLLAGAHVIYIWASTVDSMYHWRGSTRTATDGAYYQFDMQLTEIPE